MNRRNFIGALVATASAMMFAPVRGQSLPTAGGIKHTGRKEVPEELVDTAQFIIAYSDVVGDPGNPRTETIRKGSIGKVVRHRNGWIRYVEFQREDIIGLPPGAMPYYDFDVFWSERPDHWETWLIQDSARSQVYITVSQ